MSWLSKTFKKIASPLEDLAGSALGAFIGGSIGSHFDNSVNATSSKQYLELSKQLFEYQNRNKYQFMVDDLNKAGLNPMLAVGGLQGSAGGIVNGSSRTSDENGINNATAVKAQLRIAEKNADTELLKAKAEARLASSRADTEDYMRSINGAFVNAQTIESQHRVSNDALRLSMEFDDLLMRKEVHGYQVQKIIAEIKQLASIANLNDAKYQQIMADVNSLDKKYHKDWLSTEPGRDLFKVADIIKTLVGAIGTIGVLTGNARGAIKMN